MQVPTVVGPERSTSLIRSFATRKDPEIVPSTALSPILVAYLTKFHLTTQLTLW
jgi:hypothetical protein